MYSTFWKHFGRSYGKDTGTCLVITSVSPEFSDMIHTLVLVTSFTLWLNYTYRHPNCTSIELAADAFGFSNGVQGYWCNVSSFQSLRAYGQLKVKFALIPYTIGLMSGSMSR